MSLLKRKRFWATVLALGLSVYLFRDFKFYQIWTLIKGINLWYLIPLSILEIVIAFVRSQRWKYIIDPGKKITTLNIFSTYSIGMMMNLLLPALTGQVARIFLLAKKEEIKKTFAFTSVVLEVLFDAIILIGLLFFVSYFYVFPDLIRSWEVIGGILVVALAVFLYWVSRRHHDTSHDIEKVKHKHSNFAERIIDIKNSFVYGLRMLRSSKHLFLVTGLTIISWSLQAMMVYLVIEAVDLQIDLWGAVVIMVINTVMVMVVVTPVNVGTFQLACVFALSLFDINKQTALSFSIVLHAFNYFPPVLLGWFFSLREGLSFKKMYRERKEKEDIDLERVKITEEVKK